LLLASLITPSRADDQAVSARRVDGKPNNNCAPLSARPTNLAVEAPIVKPTLMPDTVNR
jgi:hypothetical protein